MLGVLNRQICIHLYGFDDGLAHSKLVLFSFYMFLFCQSDFLKGLG